MTKITPELLMERLQQFAAEKGVVILMAAESGSRGWGFASPDSDYDMRFVFTHTEEQLLTPFSLPDTLHYKDADLDLDYEGWSLAKVMKALRASNTVVLEWAQSPIIYYEAPRFSTMLLALFGKGEDFRVRGCVSHYQGLAQKSRNEGKVTVYGPGQRMKVKKLFYALRSYLSSLYVMKNGHMPPMAWSELVVACHEYTDPLKESFAELMAEKTTNGEKHVVYVPDDVAKFIMDTEATLNAWFKGLNESRELPSVEKYVSFYRWALKEYTSGVTLVAVEVSNDDQ